MNKFKNLAKKLISNKLWANTVNIIPLIASTNQKNRVIYSDGTSIENVSAVIKTVKTFTEQHLLKLNTQVIVPKASVSVLDLTGKIAIQFNSKRYNVISVTEGGILGNEAATVEFILEK